MFLKKNINVDVFDDVLQNAKHRANDASNDVNRPPLAEPQFFKSLYFPNPHPPPATVIVKSLFINMVKEYFPTKCGPCDASVLEAVLAEAEKS